MASALDALTLVKAFDLSPNLSDTDRCIPGDADAELLLDLDDERLTFSSRQLAAAVQTTAACLLGAARAVNKASAKGLRVCVVLPNCAEYVTVYLGVANVSAVNCLLNPKFKQEEFAFAMKDMGCELVLLQGGPKSMHLPEAERAAQSLNLPIFYVHWAFEGTDNRPTPRFSRDRLVVDGQVTPSSQAEVEKAEAEVKGSDLALLLHTSGTTAAPKTVPITHCNNVATLHNIGHTYRWDPKARRECGLLIMPLFHVHGLFAGCLSPLSQGCRVVLARGGGFHKSTFWEDAVKSQCTWVTAVPTMWQILLNTAEETLKPHRRDDGSLPVALRFIRGCSSALPAPVAEALEGLLNTQVLEAYAMSEATHQMCSNPLADNDGKLRRRFGSVGLPQGIDLAIIDPETGTITARGEPGEICVRGYNVITGYLGLSDEDQKKHFWAVGDLKESSEEGTLSYISNTPNLNLQDKDYKVIMANYRNTSTPLPYRYKLQESPINDRSFLRTGDIGVMDKESGFVSLVGRSKELINRGGEKISPLEIDAVFLKFDEIIEAGAFGVPDSMLGEIVYLAVVLKEAVEPSTELFSDLRSKAQQYLARFKIPVKIYACPELPKGNTGKILRRELWNFIQKQPNLSCF